jgi:hypothetical protein
MKGMRACPACPGFVPEHLTTCPHCGAGGRWQRLVRTLAGLAGSAGALVTLAACYGAPPYIDTCVDQDNDGWLPGCYNDDLSCDPDDVNCDCRDYDPSIHPEANDPIDGVDRDCDGKDTGQPEELVDAGLPDAWAPDGSVP